MEKSGLPQGRVTTVVIGSPAKQVLERPLQKLGVSAVWLKPSNRLPEAVSGHADMLFCHLGKDIAVTESEEAGALLAGALCPKTPPAGKYPQDVGLNAAVVGKCVFHNFKYTDKALLEALNKPSFKKIQVRQGYSKCSICIVDDGAIITEDNGIYAAARSAGFEALLIERGAVDLKGYPYGFLGGASGKLSKDTIAFTGTLDFHPSKNEILEFIRSRGQSAVFLSEQRIFDVGSIIPIKEIVDKSDEGR